MIPEVTIGTIAIVATIALVGGIFFSKLKQPSILAYLLTGVIVGPSCFGLIPSKESIDLLAEFGVLLLLFIIGMELHIKIFKQHLFTSSMCVISQTIVGFVISWILSLCFDWPLIFTIALSFVFALSSTAVVMNNMEEMNMTKSSISKLIVGILIAQDIAVIFMILTLQAMTSRTCDLRLFAKVIVSLAFMTGLIIFLTSRPNFSFSLKRWLGSNKDLYMLTSLAICFFSAAVSEGLGITAPYGAFIAGFIIGNISENNNLLVESIQPIQKLFLMIFFISIGIMFDIKFVGKHLLLVSTVLVMVTIVKTISNIYILRRLKIDLPQASFVGISLAQIGELAFLLTTILDKQDNSSFEIAENCLISVTVLSLALSPIWLKLGRRVQKLLKRTEKLTSATMVRYTIGYAAKRFKFNLHSFLHCKLYKKTQIKGKKIKAKFLIRIPEYFNQKVVLESGNLENGKAECTETENTIPNGGEMQSEFFSDSARLEDNESEGSTANGYKIKQVKKSINNKTKNINITKE
ncbi:MAG: cation:proton antiporter [Holosporales bacterium]|nr:cation:proton antiporter [Holosporales bacterium]